jgi:xanthine dehydrogenase YagS FAD-binding subunit
VLPDFAYVRPTTVADAANALAASAARALAGGTDLVGCLRDRVFDASTLVSLGALADLKGVRELADGALRIGALTTIAAVAADPTIRARYPALAEAARSVASPQLRNQGTLGGNLCQKPRCWYYRGDFDCLRKGGPMCYAAGGENEYHAVFGGGPCVYVHPSDAAPALVALGASARTAGVRGPRTIPLEEFYVRPDDDVTRETALDPGEIVTDVLLPAPAPNERSTYRKVRARQTWDFALVGAAIVLRMTGDRVTAARVVLSGVAAVPWRAREAETALTGRRLDAASIRRAAAAAAAGADPLEKNGYKVPLIAGLVEERLTALTTPA